MDEPMQRVAPFRAKALAIASILATAPMISSGSLAATARPRPASTTASRRTLPRSSDGHPDFSGLWVAAATGRVSSAFGGQDRTNGPVPARPRRARAAVTMPYTPEYQQKYAAILQSRARGDVTSDPTANCVPQGMPRLLTGNPYPWEILQTPKQINIYAEWMEQ